MEKNGKCFLILPKVTQLIIMAKFIGEYKGKLDDKGRLVFPAGLKAGVPENEPLKFVVKPGLFAPCLEIYTYAEWEKESEALKAKLNFYRKEDSLFWRTYMRNRVVIEPDAKIGRFSLPKELLDKAGIVKDVIFSGSDYKIELWAIDRYEEAILPDEEYVPLAEKLLG